MGGRVRNDGYRIDLPQLPPISSLPSASQVNGSLAVVPLPSRARIPPSAVSPGKPPDPRRPADRTRLHRVRRHRETGCRNPQVRKGIGSMVFVLGIPCLIAGLIFTIVSSEDDEGGDSKYPEYFPVLGPVLLALSLVCFLVGVLLYNLAILKGLQECLDLNEEDSLCRRCFPGLCRWLKPDPNAARNRTAISNLQTAPARSALRKMPNPDLPVVAFTAETEKGQGQGQGQVDDDLRPRAPRGNGNGVDLHLQHGPEVHVGGQVRRKRAVTFSQGDDSGGEGGGRVVRGVATRSSSLSSEVDRWSYTSDSVVGGVPGGSLNGHSPSSSLLSLRHCKIRPKDEVFWSAGEESEGDGDGEGRRGRGMEEWSESRRLEKSDDDDAGGGGGGSDGGGRGSLSGDDGGGEGEGEGVNGGGGGGHSSGRVTLTNIDEEPV